MYQVPLSNNKFKIYNKNMQWFKQQEIQDVGEHAMMTAFFKILFNLLNADFFVNFWSTSDVQDGSVYV